MMLKRGCLYIVFLLLLVAAPSKAQRTMLERAQESIAAIDTIPSFDLDESSLDNINDLQKQFEKQNRTYSVPRRPGAHLRRTLQKDETTLSREALFWARKTKDPSTYFDEYVTFRDTIIVNPIFLPPVFRGNVLPDDLVLYDLDFLKEKSPYDSFYQPDTTIFSDYLLKKKINDMTMAYLEKNHPTAFRYSERDMPEDIITTDVLQKPKLEKIRLDITSDVNFDDIGAPAKFIPDRQYWTSAFESAIQFSQNYISPNWHKGGSSNMNLFTKHYIKYDYNRDKVKLTNEMEVKVSFYNASKDTIHKYNVGEDVFRLHSNIGYQAFNKWYYTFDAEFKTQLFTNYQENSQIRNAALLSPITISLGIGMKYDLEKQYEKKHKNIKLSVNLAPASYTYLYSFDKGLKMDLGRHGFKKKENPAENENPFENTLSRFGSTIRTDMTMNFSRNISWQSRFYYFTTYDQVIAEFENTLILAITRHFSTRIYAHLRFDDSVTKTEDFDSYFQLNELLSFGFNYKW